MRLGAPIHHIEALAQAKKQKALEDAKRMEGVIVPLRQSGASLRTICGVLNASGERTSKGGVFYPPLVSQMLKRLSIHQKRAEARSEQWTESEVSQICSVALRYVKISIFILREKGSP